MSVLRGKSARQRRKERKRSVNYQSMGQRAQYYVHSVKKKG